MNASHFPKVTLSKKLATTLDDLRARFTDFTSTLSAISTRRSELAPAFMAAYEAYARETGRTFVAFVRELDPTCPADRDKYPNHRSFQAALYLRRLHEAPETTVSHRQTPPPMEVLAMVVRGALQHAKSAEAYWAEIQRASRWRERDMARLKQRVSKARGIPLGPTVRLVKRAAVHAPAPASERHVH